MNQQIFKQKLKAAEGGHKLLKKKADALKVSRLLHHGRISASGAC
jgi:vacuolar-type H+-ATPase subunit D/Vma8